MSEARACRVCVGESREAAVTGVKPLRGRAGERLSIGVGVSDQIRS